MNFSTRLTVTMVALVVLTAGGIGIVAFQSLNATLIPTGIARAESRVHQDAVQFDANVQAARGDVLTASYWPSAIGFADASAAGGRDPRDGTPVSVWRNRLAMQFAAELQVRPDYTQFRLLDKEGHELVRVDRSGTGGAIREVPEHALQDHGARGYFQATHDLAQGAIYVSPIELNQEHGKVQVPHMPVTRVATPLFDSNGLRFGLLIVDVDMREALASLEAATPPGGQLYLVNDAGDFLLNPDPAKGFGFDLGVRHRLRDLIPSLPRDLAGMNDKGAVVRDTSGSRPSRSRRAAKTSSKRSEANRSWCAISLSSSFPIAMS